MFNLLLLSPFRAYNPLPQIHDIMRPDQVEGVPSHFLLRALQLGPSTRSLLARLAVIIGLRVKQSTGSHRH